MSAQRETVPSSTCTSQHLSYFHLLKMHFATRFMLVLVGALLVASEAQYGGYYDYPAQYFFRGGYNNNPYPTYGGALDYQRPQQVDPQARFFFTTITLTLTTTTTTSTSTSVTTCTTSTGTLSTCTAGRRRRQGLLPRGLAYNEEEELDSIFISSPKKQEEPVARIEDLSRPLVRDTPPVPYVVQPGFRAPETMGSGRFLLAFGTSTTTTTTTTTSTSTLTAVCSSTTSYSTCGSSGK